MNEGERLFTVMAELASALATTTAVKAISDATGVSLQPSSLIEQNQITAEEYLNYKEAARRLAASQETAGDLHQTLCDGYVPLQRL